MAIYHLSVKAVSRSSGRSATAAAAYRAGCKIEDVRSGDIHDYTRKGGVESADIVLPDGAPEWATDRAKLWNAAELAEKRKDACVAREIEVALPSELSPAERRRLALDFAKDMANREGCAVDVAIHAPGKDGDNRNHHAHILRTTRKVEADGLGEKLDTEKAGRKRSEDLEAVRARWAAMTNERLRENGIAARVDHRTLEAQGIDREPTLHLGPAASGYERRTGEPSRKRLDFEAEIAERLARAKEAGDLERQSHQIDQDILDLSGDLQAALRERDQAQADPAALLAEWQAMPPVAGPYGQSFERQGIAVSAAEALRDGLPPGALMGDEERQAMRSAGWLDSRDEATPKGVAVLRYVADLERQQARAEQERKQRAEQELKKRQEQARQQAEQHKAALAQAVQDRQRQAEQERERPSTDSVGKTTPQPAQPAPQRAGSALPEKQAPTPARALFARLPSNADALCDDLRQADQPPEKIRVVGDMELSPSEYDKFTADFSAPQPWLDGKGGLDEDGSRHVIEVTAKDRQTLHIDPAGYAYARSVGIPEADVQRVVDLRSLSAAKPRPLQAQLRPQAPALHPQPSAQTPPQPQQQQERQQQAEPTEPEMDQWLAEQLERDKEAMQKLKERRGGRDAREIVMSMTRRNKDRGIGR